MHYVQNFFERQDGHISRCPLPATSTPQLTIWHDKG